MARRKTVTPEEWIESYRLMSQKDQRKGWELLVDLKGLPPQRELAYRERGTQMMFNLAAEFIRRADRLSRRDEKDMEDIVKTVRLLCEGKTQLEVAGILKRTPDAIKKRVKKARQLGLYRD